LTPPAQRRTLPGGVAASGKQEAVVFTALGAGGSAERDEDQEAARLVTAFQGGDKEAFAGLYLRYFDRVYGYLRVAFKDRHEAEDGTQQVFTKVFEALPEYEQRRQPFRAWLFVIVRNYAISQLSRQGRVEAVDPAELDRHREATSLQADSDAELRTLSWITDSDMLVLVERLPIAQRQVLALRFMLDLSLKQAATVLGRTPNDIAALQHRAIVFLRARLTALGRAPTQPGENRMRAWLAPAQVIRRRRSALKR
jgi:RNA polymerase sigma-70 factor (ECF subfamily)